MIDFPIHDDRFVSPIAPTKRKFDRYSETLGLVFHAVKLGHVAMARHEVTGDSKFGVFHSRAQIWSCAISSHECRNAGQIAAANRLQLNRLTTFFTPLASAEFVCENRVK
jgi:hypothetical protein